MRYFVICSMILLPAHAWIPNHHRVRVPLPATSRTTLAAGGFGGGGSAKKQKEVKLKPKQQWDRYLDMKRAGKSRVAVRTPSGEWLEIGRVRSKEGVSTEVAVARQRALIADHARRLYPLKVSQKDRVEWGYFQEDDWTVVDKAVLDGEELKGVEKNIGFEGEADPNTGFYCYYNEGKLVKSGDEVAQKSKKLE